MKKYLMLCLLMSFAAFMGCQNTDNPVADSSQQGPTNTLGETNAFANAAAKFDQQRPQIDAQIAEYKANYAQASIIAKKKRSANSIAGSKITVPDDFPTIQEAVDAADPGDKIKVKESGSPYTEDVVVSVPDVRITAEGDVTLNGSFFVVADGVQIDHFTINSNIFLILLNNVSDVDVKDNTLFNSLFAIFVVGSDGCNIKNNNISQSEIGMILVGSTGNDVDDNTVSQGVGGVGLEGSHDNTISGNNCNGIGGGFGAYDGSSENQFKDNQGNNNEFIGIEIGTGANNNTIGSDNEFNDNGESGIFLHGDTFENEIKKNEATGNGIIDIRDLGTDNEYKKNDTDVTDPPGLD